MTTAAERMFDPLKAMFDAKNGPHKNYPAAEKKRARVNTAERTQRDALRTLLNSGIREPDITNPL